MHPENQTEQWSDTRTRNYNKYNAAYQLYGMSEHKYWSSGVHSLGVSEAFAVGKDFHTEEASFRLTKVALPLEWLRRGRENFRPTRW